jgi:hypothetical protein
VGLAYEVWQVFYPLLVLGLSLAFLLCRWERTPWARRWAERVVHRFSSRGGLAWLELWHLVVAVGATLVVILLSNDLTGAYACAGTGINDPLGLTKSGLAFWSGGDPFFIHVCGLPDNIPYGMAGVLLDAVAAPAGLVAVYFVWVAVAISILPLVWDLAGEDRRYVTLLVASSALFVPEVGGQVDGASNMIVPVTVLLSLWLLRSHRWWAGVVGGFLSTARFPSLFPILGSPGRLGKDRWWVPALALGTFVGVTALTYLRWGMEFISPVFLDQVTRATGSENLLGVLIANGWYPGGYGPVAVQAALTLLLVEEVWRRKFSPLLASLVVLVGIELLTNFLSFSILDWLVPLALAGVFAQRALWVVSLVGTVNYDLAFNLLQSVYGLEWPGEVLDLATTVLLLVVFYHLWRRAVQEAAASLTTPGPAAG